MSFIKNKEELSTNELRKDALEILEAGLDAVQTEKILRDKVRVENGILGVNGGSLDLRSFNKIIFVGLGKCALDGGKIMEEILSDHLTAGAVIDVRPKNEAQNLRKLKYFQGTHPLPSPQNVEATKEILNMVGDLHKNDLVITLVSGGGSALFELPVPKWSLDAIVQRTKELTAEGADIYELNAARKEMSQVKGGKFAQICAPAQVLSLIFSDVPGNDLSVIASGPTIIDWAKNILICSNMDALRAMAEKAQGLGYETKIETDRLTGNATEVGEQLARRERKPGSCLLFGGETTVKVVPDHGVGGRNQELALSALTEISEETVLISAASDGWDNTDHAGALADSGMMLKARLLGLLPESFLLKSDSYHFWKSCEGALSTGQLGSNVSDLVIMLYK